MEEESEAPWSIEVPKSQVNFLLGPNGSTLKRLSAATGCELEVSKQPKRKLKKISYGGQDQYLDDDDDGDKQPVKVFMRGPARRRLVASEVLRGVAAGDDPEDHAAKAEGAVVFPHTLGGHPDMEAWARWRLLTVAHEFGAAAHVGRRTVRLAPLSRSAPFSEEAAEAATAAAERVLEEALALEECKVDARDELEPEEAPSDAALAPFVDQHGVMIRVLDQDDNAVSEFITVRLFGPAAPVADCAALVRARFVDGKATASVLQPPGRVQSLPPEFATDFSQDLRDLESECGVKVGQGHTALWVSGDEQEKVVSAKKMLQEMLQFYLPKCFHLVSGLAPAAVEELYADLALGALMARPGCAVALDAAEGSAWICGEARAEAQARVEEAIRLSQRAAPEGEPPAAKRRRVSALSFHSQAH